MAFGKPLLKSLAGTHHHSHPHDQTRFTSHPTPRRGGLHGGKRSWQRRMAAPPPEPRGSLIRRLLQPANQGFHPFYFSTMSFLRLSCVFRCFCQLLAASGARVRHALGGGCVRVPDMPDAVPQQCQHTTSLKHFGNTSPAISGRASAPTPILAGSPALL